ncbi:unnamed protein product [Rotaria socialis]
MSRTQPPKSTLSKLEIQALVTSDDPSISFPKPANAKSEVWTDYSKGYYENEGLDYIICPRCRYVYISIHIDLIEKLSGMTIYNAVPVSHVPVQKSSRENTGKSRSRRTLVHGFQDEPLDIHVDPRSRQPDIMTDRIII